MIVFFFGICVFLYFFCIFLVFFGFREALLLTLLIGKRKQLEVLYACIHSLEGMPRLSGRKKKSKTTAVFFGQTKTSGDG